MDSFEPRNRGRGLYPRDVVRILFVIGLLGMVLQVVVSGRSGRAAGDFVNGVRADIASIVHFSGPAVANAESAPRR